MKRITASQLGTIEVTRDLVGFKEHSKRLAEEFYYVLRREVMTGNPYLSKEEQDSLQKFYPVMMKPERYPCECTAAIYSSRRAYPVEKILGSKNSVVFDAGCGYGSESFLFASLGARVLAIDGSVEQIAIARKRQRYFEEYFERSLDITFVRADLDDYVPGMDHFTVTWLSSVLAYVRDQEAVLARIYASTQQHGAVIITDMNLWNPIFLYSEWQRRRKAHPFENVAEFSKMFLRKGTVGARYDRFEDHQYFTVTTLSSLIRKAGFSPFSTAYSGFAAPMVFGRYASRMESAFSRLPGVRAFGFFYLITGVKN